MPRPRSCGRGRGWPSSRADGAHRPCCSEAVRGGSRPTGARVHHRHPDPSATAGSCTRSSPQRLSLTLRVSVVVLALGGHLDAQRSFLPVSRRTFAAPSSRSGPRRGRPACATSCGRRRVLALVGQGRRDLAGAGALVAQREASLDQRLELDRLADPERARSDGLFTTGAAAPGCRAVDRRAERDDVERVDLGGVGAAAAVDDVALSSRAKSCRRRGCRTPSIGDVAVIWSLPGPPSTMSAPLVPSTLSLPPSP